MTRADHASPSGSDPVLQALRSSDEVGDELAALRLGLADAARREGLLEIGYRIEPSPYGDLLMAATETGLVRVAFAVEQHDQVLGSLADVISPRILHAPRWTDAAARELEEYFDRRRHRFDVPLDLRLVGGFRRQVVEGLADIAYGSTASYAEVARQVGNPGAVRAVGSACSHNPLPIVLPCHRVVRSDGSLGQYLGGVEVKAALLQLEASAP
jgi:methylated-DNA-[protein]-cysteine S-methyltransferase